jgi:hypothetical protein
MTHCAEKSFGFSSHISHNFVFGLAAKSDRTIINHDTPKPAPAAVRLLDLCCSSDFAKSLSENSEGCCGEGFWLEPRRLGPSIPEAGCKAQANDGPGQKHRRSTPRNFQTGSKEKA